LNSFLDVLATYVDTTDKSGTCYVYIVESVDACGVEGAPTSPFAVSIP
jgi:hypothetical protein